MKTTLFLARHGVTEWNAHGRLQGQTNVPLSPTGQQQAAALAKRLAGVQLDAIFASDLARAWETAQIIASYQTCSPIKEPGLRESNFGDWEGLTFAEIEQRDPETLAAWRVDPQNTSTPNGEDVAQLAQRVGMVFDRITSIHPEGTVLLVAHGGSISVMLCLLLGMPPGSLWQFHLKPASLTEVRIYDEGAILNLFNDTCHYEVRE